MNSGDLRLYIIKQDIESANQRYVIGLTRYSDWTGVTELYLLSDQNMSSCSSVHLALLIKRARAPFMFTMSMDYFQ